MAEVAKLRISKEEMRSAISNFEQRKSALENAYLKISNEVRTLDGTYHGAASEQFKSQFDGLYKNLSQTESVMSNIISKLNQALQIYEETETAVQKAMDALDEAKAYLSQL